MSPRRRQYAEAIEACSALQSERTTAAEALAARRAALSTRLDTEEEPEPEPEADPRAEPSQAASLRSEGPHRGPGGRCLRCHRRADRRPHHPSPGTGRVIAHNPVTHHRRRRRTRVRHRLGDGVDATRSARSRQPDARPSATPTGNGETEDLHKFGVASFRIDFPDDLTIDRNDDDLEVMLYAGKESRLPGGSLTASGGWCAPSETLYDLCAGETTDGILRVPEVDVTRGGIKFTGRPGLLRRSTRRSASARPRRRPSPAPPRPASRCPARPSPTSGSTPAASASRCRS